MAKNTERITDKLISKSRIIFRCVAAVMVIMLLLLLIGTMINLPDVGSDRIPGNNEVSERYIEKGIEETGAINYVAGMILDYRAFDTFGESNVLFIATICVTIMLKICSKSDESSKNEDASKNGTTGTKGKKSDALLAAAKKTESDDSPSDVFEAVIDEDAINKDLILRTMSKLIIPIVMVFGVYIILNGHLSPGGGFSGGAILGAGFILCASAFGFEKISPFLNEKTIKWVTFCSLMVYCLAKSYSFFTGANHLESHIPLGTPGAILSSGLILILNICVGMVVACTMYSFYSLVKRGKV